MIARGMISMKHMSGTAMVVLEVNALFAVKIASQADIML